MAELPVVPDDVIFNVILPRLPAKSLLRFKCVSRQWNMIISTPGFAKTHVNHPSHGPTTSVLAVNETGNFNAVDYGDVNNLLDFNAVDYGDVNNLLDLNALNGDEFINLPAHRFGIEFDNPFLLLGASCNGLALLITSFATCEHNHRDFLPYHEFKYVVFNPLLSNHGFLEIQQPPQEFRRTVCSVSDILTSCDAFSFNFGFGYASSRDDYYIVAVALPWKPGCSEILVYVYSLRARQWMPRRFRMIDALGPRITFHEIWSVNAGTLVNETLHWGVTVSNGIKCIATFDLKMQEEMTFVALPYADFGRVPILLRNSFGLCCMRGCLCAWANYDSTYIEMWMLKEYGMHESWTRLFRFDSGVHWRISVLGLSDSGIGLTLGDIPEELMCTDFSVDPPQMKHTGFGNQMRAVNYFQSLVSPLAVTLEPEE